MTQCDGCQSCGGCTGCDRSLSLTSQEVAVLRRFAQLPFLPVARRADSETPVCLEPDLPGESALVLACLEKKSLIDIDYHMPLAGFDYAAYTGYPLRGSMALTARGQQVLELLEVQGAQEG